MTCYLTDIWRCRYFWLALVQMDLRTRYRRSVLGLGWSLVHPLVMTVILCFVFRRIFQIDIHDYAPLLLTGLACWQYLVSVTLQGADCFFQAQSFIRQSPLPLAIYPLRSALAGTVHFLIALGLALAVTALFKGMAHPLALLGLIPALVLFFCLVWSLALLAGVATVLFQDFRHMLEIGFQLLFYLTPILYPAQVLEEHRLSWVAQCNPIVAFLHLIRAPILDGRIPDWTDYGIAASVVACTVTLAGLVLAHMQRRLIFYL